MNTLYVKMLVGMFVIVNPLGLAPIFLSLTQGQDVRSRNAVARTACIVATITLVIGALAGRYVLEFFGISIDSFRVAGGILLLLIALGMLQAKPPHEHCPPEERAEIEAKQNVAITPLAIPLIAGPGALSSAILYSHQADTVLLKLFLIGVVLVVGLSNYLAFRSAEGIGAKLGHTGINVMSRLFGIILAALGVEFMAKGLAQLLPGLAG